jgi:predicted MFS family arabinose efflux permease
MSTGTGVAIAPGRWVLPGLYLGSFVSALPTSAAAPFLPDIATTLDTTVPVVGQVTASMLLLSAMLGLVAGPLADKAGHRRLILVGLVAAAAAELIYGGAPSVRILFAASLFGAIAAATVPGLSLAIASTHFTGLAARRAVGWTVAGLAGSAIIGVPILTTIGDAATWRAAFVASALMTLLVLVLVANWLPPDDHRNSGAVHIGDMLDSYHRLLKDPSVARLYLSCVLRAVCWFGFLTYIGAFLDERLGLSTRNIGLVYMLGGSGYFVGSLIAGGPMGRISALSMLASGNAVMALGTGVMLSVQFGRWVTIALVPLVAFAGAVGWVGLVGLLSEKSPVGSGTTMVLNSSLLNFGAFGGGAVGGALLAIGGYTALALALPVFGLAAAMVIWTFRRW